MKFLHTADWQIGMKAVHLRDKAESVRRARFQAARRAIDIARKAAVDFIVLAGDTFEHHGVARAKVREVVNLLSSAPCPVYVLPGNHDPAGPGSVWEDECWRTADKVALLTEARPVAIPGGSLMPCPALTRTSLSDPTAWIAGASAEGVRIGIAHGSVQGPIEMDLCYPIPPGAAEALKLDYLALGHHHSTALNVGGSPRMAYSGTHEPTSFGERDSGNVLIVEIEAPGASPRVQAIPSCVLEWRTVACDASSAEDVVAFTAGLEAIPDPEQILLKCVLTGEAAGADEAVERLVETVEGRFLFGQLDRDGFLVGAGGDAWADELPAGYIRNLGCRLRDEAAEGEEALASLGELRRLWREVRR